jgi:hypothetical protein
MPVGAFLFQTSTLVNRCRVSPRGIKKLKVARGRSMARTRVPVLCAGQLRASPSATSSTRRQSLPVRMNALCAVLCAVTLPEHPGLRVSAAVNGCPTRFGQTQSTTSVCVSCGPSRSLSVTLTRLVRNDEVAGSTPVSSTIDFNYLRRIRHHSE